VKMQLASLFGQLNRHIFVIPVAFLIHSENMDRRRIEFGMTLCRSNKKYPDFLMLLCLFSPLFSKVKGH